MSRKWLPEFWPKRPQSDIKVTKALEKHLRVPFHHLGPGPRKSLFESPLCVFESSIDLESARIIWVTTVTCSPSRSHNLRSAVFPLWNSIWQPPYWLAHVAMWFIHPVSKIAPMQACRQCCWSIPASQTRAFGVPVLMLWCCAFLVKATGPRPSTRQPVQRRYCKTATIEPQENVTIHHPDKDDYRRDLVVQGVDLRSAKHDIQENVRDPSPLFPQCPFFPQSIARACLVHSGFLPISSLCASSLLSVYSQEVELCMCMSTVDKANRTWHGKTPMPMKL